MNVDWGVVGFAAAVLVIALIARPVPRGPALRERREWTEDCRVFQHRHCRHIGSARTFGVGGRREFVTICGCPCHWGCPSEEVALPAMSSECICSDNGEVRQENYERYAKLSGLDRVLSRRR